MLGESNSGQIEPDWRREQRLDAIASAAGYPEASVWLDDLPRGYEGRHDFCGQSVSILLARWLTDDQAAATVLHELAHVELRHDEDDAYAAALDRDQAAGTDTDRGPWEIEADALAAALVISLPADLIDQELALDFLTEDCKRYASAAARTPMHIDQGPRSGA